MKTLGLLIALLGLLPIGLFFVGPIPIRSNSSKQDFSFLVISNESIFVGLILVICGALLFRRARRKNNAQRSQ